MMMAKVVCGQGWVDGWGRGRISQDDAVRAFACATFVFVCACVRLVRLGGGNGLRSGVLPTGTPPAPSLSIFPDLSCRWPPSTATAFPDHASRPLLPPGLWAHDSSPPLPTLPWTRSASRTAPSRPRCPSTCLRGNSQDTAPATTADHVVVWCVGVGVVWGLGGSGAVGGGFFLGGGFGAWCMSGRAPSCSVWVWVCAWARGVGGFCDTPPAAVA